MKNTLPKQIFVSIFVVALTTLVAGYVSGSAQRGQRARPAAADAGPRVFNTAHYRIRLVSVAQNLVHPYTLTFLPGGDILVTEMEGRIRLIRNGALVPEPVGLVPGVFTLKRTAGEV
jgi:glucose/arabinose dehydrogenase